MFKFANLFLAVLLSLFSVNLLSSATAHATSDRAEFSVAVEKGKYKRALELGKDIVEQTANENGIASEKTLRAAVDVLDGLQGMDGWHDEHAEIFATARRSVRDLEPFYPLDLLHIYLLQIGRQPIGEDGEPHLTLTADALAVAKKYLPADKLADVAFLEARLIALLLEQTSLSNVFSEQERATLSSRATSSLLLARDIAREHVPEKDALLRQVLETAWVLNLHDEQRRLTHDLRTDAKRLGLAQQALLKLAVEPAFPEKAKRKRTSGFVIIRFDIEPDGSVSNLEIVDSHPRGVFDRSALRAVKQWRYQPEVGENGEPIKSKGVTTALSFATY